MQYTGLDVHKQFVFATTPTAQGQGQRQWRFPITPHTDSRPSPKALAKMMRCAWSRPPMLCRFASCWLSTPARQSSPTSCRLKPSPREVSRSLFRCP